MPRYYRYFAESKKDTVVTGSIRAQHQSEATEVLKKSFSEVYLVERLSAASWRHLIGHRMRLVEKILFVKNLYVMLKAGVPLDEALQMIAAQSTSPGAKKISQSLVKKIRAGKSFSSALSTYTHIFSPFFINIIYMGEKSGTLDANLQYLGGELEHLLDLKRKIRSAMIYPVIILVMTVILGGLMIRFVLPEITKVFKAINLQLPLQTRIFLGGAEFIQTYGLLMFLIIAVAVAVFRLLLARFPRFNLLWTRFILRIPFVGYMVMSYNLAQITRTLGVLLRAGTPLTEALDTTARTADNLYFKRELIVAKKAVSHGLPLGESFAHGGFDILVSQLTLTGEKTGSLENNLLYLSDFYNNRIDYMTKDLPVILEPTLLIIVGITVAFFAVSILSPIYEFTSSVGR
ncbi:MAG: hypothetical protein A3B30_01700 [Candidatus Komeilibacteria bacterium RIFCSPLOWO2_01_FULL_52_15]|uniref:Type II secretion system protein GspF domain-containing protein n=1 Tax=Candidatus Komeilibacteria bacterium RIFCSPLOWO2_01_FULL_52_15 TaxID=1798551 RepID=A0A1G2BQ90_9BACT|nr:MAG: hypothetical protein A3B30_01700 [Candidatus Komeilibacteria bacterium RIFCSPLOWO2_01_FULL_52_15]